MSFIVYAWVASISYTVVTIVAKLTSKYSIPNPWLFGFLYSLFIFIFTIFPAFAANGTNLLPTSWTPVILAGLFFGLGTLFFTLSVFKLDASVISSLFNFRTLFAVVLASIILKESLNSLQTFLIAIIVIAGLFSTIDERLSIKSFFHYSTLIGLLTMIFVALQGIFTNLSLKENSYWTLSLWMPFISTVFLFVFTFPLFWKDIKRIKLTQIGAMILIALFDTLATLAINKAFEMNVGITSVIVSLPLSMVVAAGLSYFKPGLIEKHTVKVYAIRFIAAFIMIAAALKLS